VPEQIRDHLDVDTGFKPRHRSGVLKWSVLSGDQAEKVISNAHSFRHTP
jgi:hypothetical protein